ncbi:bifunctional DNA primase/polymerase [Thermodesulfobacteriota bacterium]
MQAGNVIELDRGQLGEIALATAIEMGPHGFRVHPLHGINSEGDCTCGDQDCGNKAGKHPRLPKWQERASADIGKIEEWWEESPEANIGITIPPNAMVLDIDGEQGVDSLISLETEFGPLPETWTSKTGRGEHRFFKLPDGVRLKNSSGRVGVNLDIKTGGGYVVGARSNHVSGKQYAWMAGINPTMSDWLKRRNG